MNLLINASSNVNHQDQFGWTALEYASYFNHSDIVNALIAAGANVKILDNYGNNALMWGISV